MLPNIETNVGSPRSRVDGPAKVTGAARYAAEFTGARPRPRRRRVERHRQGQDHQAGSRAAALAVPGVVQVFTHENRPRTAWFDYKYRDEVAPPGEPFRPLYDGTILYSGQPIALVVAEDFETATYAASLVQRRVRGRSPETDLDRQSGRGLRAAEEAQRHRAAAQAARAMRSGAFDGAPVKVSPGVSLPLRAPQPDGAARHDRCLAGRRQAPHPRQEPGRAECPELGVERVRPVHGRRARGLALRRRRRSARGCGRSTSSSWP